MITLPEGKKKVKRSKVRVPPHKLPVEERINNFKVVHLGYLSYEEVKAEADRCIQCGGWPKCEQGCPAHCHIKDYLFHIREGSKEEAVRLVYQYYAFPAALHRICPGLCVDQCVVGKKGDPVNIVDIVRWIADNIPRPKDWYDVKPSTGKKIAIIGSGPAGLTAGYFLRKQGHEVVIYEKAPIPGGMLTLGIPEYRLERDVIYKEIKEIEKTGVKILLNKEYGRDFNYKDLFEQGFDAILFTHGAHKPKWMNIPGEDLDGVMHAIDFLREVNLGNPPKLGKKVAVIGGGDVAIDAVRVAKRLGADSFIVYRRSIEEMPAIKSEIEEAQEEGIPIHFLTNPVEIIGDENGHVKAMKLVKMKLGEPDESGRRRPIPIEGSEYIMEVDNVIQAVSQKPDEHPFSEEGFKLTRWGTFEVDPETNMTNIEGVFAAGDDVTGPYLAITAIADAHKAWRGIHQYLTGERIEFDWEEKERKLKEKQKR